MLTDFIVTGKAYAGTLKGFEGTAVGLVLVATPRSRSARLTRCSRSIMCTGILIVRALFAIRAERPAGSTRWRRSRTCSRGASRTSHRTDQPNRALLDQIEERNSVALDSASRWRRRAGGSS